jgi:hypothetical protein
MSSNNRNSWVLCNTHNGCDKCKKCVSSWRSKANKNGYKASALKFVLDCILNDDSITYKYDTENNTIPEMPIIETEGKPIKYKCNICMENMTIGGKRDVCAMGCGHTICYSCANNQHFRSKGSCPFCRKEVSKIIKLYYDEAPTDDVEN